MSAFVDHLRCIRSNQTARSLIELTGDKDVFVYLHRYFVFLLKAGGQRVTECILEGPPQVWGHTFRFVCWLPCVFCVSLFRVLYICIHLLTPPHPHTPTHTHTHTRKVMASPEPLLQDATLCDPMASLDKPVNAREFSVVQGTCTLEMAVPLTGLL